MTPTQIIRFVFGYIRVSTDAQETARQEQTIPDAHKRLPDGLANIPLHPFFYDHGISAYSGATRPGFEEMKARIQAGEAAALIIDTSSRLTRQGMRHATELFWMFEDANCRLFTTTGKEYTFDMPGLLQLIIDADRDKDYSGDLSHNIRSGNEAMAKAGRYHQGAIVPGYVRREGGIIEYTDDLQHFTEAFRLFGSEGATFERARAYLNATLAEDTLGRWKNNEVSRRQLLKYLQNPIYMGKIVHRGNVYDGLHKPAVTPELFELVQQRLRENSKKFHGSRKPRSWPFSGIAKCHVCGYSLRIHPISRGGRRYTYIRCSGEDCPERHRLPIAGAWEANVVTGLVSVAFALRRMLEVSPEFGITPKADDLPTLEEAREALAVAKDKFALAGRLAYDGSIPENGPEYREAQRAKNEAQDVLNRVSNTVADYRDQLAAYADRILALAEHRPEVPGWERWIDRENPSISFQHNDGTTVELLPERTEARVLAGWPAADFETKREVIEGSLARVTAGPEEVTLELRTPDPMTITLASAIASARGAEMEAVEAAGYGVQQGFVVTPVGTTGGRSTSIAQRGLSPNEAGPTT